METHAALNAWSDETFGPVSSNFRIASRANEELAEAIRALAIDPTSTDAAVEAADTIIVLCRLASQFGVDWADFTYVPGSMPRFGRTVEYFTFANLWMGQLFMHLSEDDCSPDVPAVLNHIYRALHHAIRRYGLSPHDVIADKMRINRARVWTKNGDGTGKHVRLEKLALTNQVRSGCAVRAAIQDDRPGLKSAGTFMGFPVFTSAGCPDDAFAVLTRRLWTGDVLDAVSPRDGVTGKVVPIR